MLVQDKKLLTEPLAILEPERYMLLYKKGNNWYEIYDDFQVLQTLDAMWCQDTQGVRTYRILVLRCPDDTEERRSSQKMLTDLIGYDLSAAATDRLSELNFTRRKFASPRKEELQRRDPKAYALEPWTTSVPITKDQQSKFTQALSVTLYYGDLSFKLKVDITMAANYVLNAFKEIMSENGHTLECAADDLVLKVCGREEFISGKSQLSDFLWVRQCLKTKQEMHLSVLPFTSLEKDTVRMEDLPLVDSFTGLSNSHNELTLANKDVDDVLMISLWDCERKFRVKLLGFDIPNLPCSAPSDVEEVGDMSMSPLSMSGDTANLQRLKKKSVHFSANLPQYLRKVDWLKPRAVQDVHWLLHNWDPKDLDVPTALELLSVDFADEQVRKLAVEKLESLSNSEILRYLLQLVQTLKVEPYHDSFLARFLIQRALQSKRIGHFFFWYLRSEVTGSPYFRQRLAAVLEAYLLGCGQAMLDSFQRQVELVKSLEEVAIGIKKHFPEKTDLAPNAAALVQDMLRTCKLPVDFQVPFDPRIRAGPILLDCCKVMASKKKPLWLEFSSACSEGPPNPPVGIIFKHGDDLRQDMLVIQTLTIMDSIWQEKSLDLNLVPYGCIATGYNIGMIEIVRNAATIATVQRTKGGSSGAFRNDTLFEWLKGRNMLQEIHFNAMERFVTSCAGYCVATYVLGIGDRHNDNIMIMDQGNLFHIDFGHIMGNTKRFLGVNRERSPFVLTPDFLYVMGRVGSLYFQRFTDTCVQAYLALRCHSHLLITLFSLMLLTGIPELSCAQDITYLREALQEGRSEEEAGQHFLQQIAECERLGVTVQANWWIHMLMGIKG
ncbi:hypothetical protein COCON_G00143280 [Conger conger]|uniref:phosphatidylinositol 3-kinase n=1 Tax=Conger conger TaxID=82655 RepID=A0A9Q1DC24_CONCO|nr:hypothetical protein COCON_G00143280 [Conger conger]